MGNIRDILKWSSEKLGNTYGRRENDHAEPAIPAGVVRHFLAQADSVIEQLEEKLAVAEGRALPERKPVPSKNDLREYGP